MNLSHGLEDQSPLLFWAVFAAGLVVGTATRGWVTKNGDDKGPGRGKRRQR